VSPTRAGRVVLRAVCVKAVGVRADPRVERPGAGMTQGVLGPCQSEHDTDGLVRAGAGMTQTNRPKPGADMGRQRCRCLPINQTAM
jgi:hypothetical protein